MCQSVSQSARHFTPLLYPHGVCIKYSEQAHMNSTALCTVCSTRHSSRMFEHTRNRMMKGKWTCITHHDFIERNEQQKKTEKTAKCSSENKAPEKRKGVKWSARASSKHVLYSFSLFPFSFSLRRWSLFHSQRRRRCGRRFRLCCY